MANLNIKDAETIQGSIKGAAAWLADARENLIKKGVSKPSNAQIASYYNSSRQDGEVGSYGKQVMWTYGKIKDEEFLPITGRRP